MLPCISSHYLFARMFWYILQLLILLVHFCTFFALIPLGHQDALLDKHIAEDTFSDQELQDTGRPVKSLVVRYFFSSCLTSRSLFISFLVLHKFYTFCPFHRTQIRVRLVFYIIQSRISPALICFSQKYPLNYKSFSMFNIL